MRRCIDLANFGAGYVSPNPLVGSVIIADGRIIGEGYHQIHGGAHAEANAIQNVIKKHDDAEQILKRATLYVNLEPCAHYGKTPPCSDLIIKHQISEVVIGCHDPFKLVDGQGITKLRNAGVKVVENVLSQECLELNRRFFTRVQKQRPYIILKWAQTKDGYFAPADGSQRWISSKVSKHLVHKWRAEEDAVLVGKNTALTDNPQLNVRLSKGRDPIRMVIDRNLQLPSTLNLFDQSQKTIVFNALKTELNENIKLLELEDFDNLLPQLICYQLYLMDTQSIIIEGGAQTLKLFIHSGLWDEARIFTSSEIWTDGVPAPQLNIIPLTTESLGVDTFQTFRKF